LDLSSPGTGKTRVYVEAFAEYHAEHPDERLLVVCPSTLMETAWGADIARFAPILTVAYAVAGVSRGVNKRLLAFKSSADVVVINTDGVKWLAEHRELLADFSWMVIDELTHFKHRTAQRSKALKEIKDDFEHRAGLTGTWVAKTVEEAWHQALIIDDGARLGTSFSKFRNQLCIPVDNGFGIDWEDKPQARELLSLLVKEIVIRHAFEEVMHLPENRSTMRYVQLGAKARKAYDAMERDALLELSKGDVTAVNAAVLRQKVLQIASGAVYHEDHKYSVIDTFRYEYIADLIEERPHSVVFFIWRHQRDELIKQLNKRGVTHAHIDGSVANTRRTTLVDEFQAGKYQTMLLHPDTGAHGLTLTKATSTIWCSPIYKPDFLQQGIHRIYRGGQTQKTENIMVAAQDTVEHAIYDKLNTEHTSMMGLLDMLKSRQQLAEAA
jgi:SNF2 family DNA or RNA helicase